MALGWSNGSAIGTANSGTAGPSLRGTSQAAIAKAEERDWGRNLSVLMMAIFIEETGWSLTAPFLPLYIHRDLGVPDLKEAALWTGVVMAASMLINSPMTPIWGALADRYGRKLILLRAFVALVLANLSAGLVMDVQQLVGVRLASAFFTGAVPLSYAIITSSAPRAQLAQSIAYLQTVTIAATAVGPLIGGVVADSMGVRPSFYVASGLCFISLFMIIFLFREPKRAERGHSTPEASQVTMRQAIVGLLPFVGLLFLVQVIDRSFQPVIPVYMAALEGSDGMVGFWSGLTFSLAGAGMAVSANVLARLSRTHSPLRLLIVCLSGAVALCVPLSLLQNVWQLVLARTALTLVVGGANTLVFTAGSQMGLGRGSIGKSAVLVMGQQTGSSLGSLLGGGVAQWSLRGVFLVDAALYAAAALLAATAVRTRLAGSRSRLSSIS